MLRLHISISSLGHQHLGRLHSNLTLRLQTSSSNLGHQPLGGLAGRLELLKRHLQAQQVLDGYQVGVNILQLRTLLLLLLHNALLYNDALLQVSMRSGWMSELHRTALHDPQAPCVNAPSGLGNNPAIVSAAYTMPTAHLVFINGIYVMFQPHCDLHCTFHFFMHISTRD